MTFSNSLPQAEPTGDDGSFDGRWDAWRARGLTNERATRRLLSGLMPALLVVGVTIYVLILIW